MSFRKSSAFLVKGTWPPQDCAKPIFPDSKSSIHGFPMTNHLYQNYFGKLLKKQKQKSSQSELPFLLDLFVNKKYL